MKIVTRNGFPANTFTYQEPNFTSQLYDAYLDTLCVAPRFSTPEHRESVEAVGHWNSAQNDILNRDIHGNGSDSDLHLPYLLFTYREVPHSTTGVSPFQMVYDRIPPRP